ncbi:GNAT family N-acetyltransferase [Candidatus Bathyarchaeota archaeon]|nr:GNAT family N-acetyltransferase [Candidatus Bathyarchaeota archaeon]
MFIEGMKEKRRWAAQLIERYGSIAKLAYLDSKPVGLIQYQPIPEERLVEITCIFVPEEENLRKGVGRSLLKALMEKMNEVKPFFDNKPPSPL